MTSISSAGRVQFRFFRPFASHVSVAGNFNEWRPKQLSMTPLGDGWWQAEADLPAGEYRFRYVADGEWYTDFAACGIEPGQFGWDSLLVVPRHPSSLRAPRRQAPDLSLMS